MSAYLIAQINVTDPEKFERYRDKVPAVIERHGGRYLVRGGATDVLVPRGWRAEVDEQPPRGSTLQVERADGAVTISWVPLSLKRALLLTLAFMAAFVTIPILPFVWIKWALQLRRRAHVKLSDDALDLRLFGPLRYTKRLVAKREEVGAIRLQRWGTGTILTVDVENKRVIVARANQGTSSALKAPEIDWAYRQLQAWKNA